MRHLVTLALSVCCISLFAGGLTVELPLPAGAHPGPQAPVHIATSQADATPPQAPTPSREEWYVQQQLELQSYLPAGGYAGLLWQGGAPQFEQTAGDLTEDALAAVAKSPGWIRPALRNVMCQLNSVDQNRWALVINEAQNPYIDEIAFCVAHTSVEFLSSEYGYPQLFAENAEMLYEIDESLSYVQITDTGAWPDEDYWSTTTYTRLNENGETEQVPVPRDIYYWYVVQPKITDDIPAFIDPTTIENNATHVNNIDPDGVFWRTWFWSHADDDYPLLADALADIDYLWVRDGSATANAILAVQGWVNDSMEFTSDNERPHQPVRIYRKHIGRCGEHADITSAAARTALIPCTGILSLSTDHTWNEFWESDWVSWEPVNGYLNNPLVYENGWGKVFGSVFEIRPDGWLTPVTDRYSEAWGTLTVHVLDSEDRPIDGARIVLGIMDGTVRSDMVGFTDCDGDCTFVVGDARDYFMHVSTPLGDYPTDPEEFALLVEDMPDGGAYVFDAPIEGTLSWPAYTGVDVPADDTDDYRFAVQYEVVQQIISGIATWDDIDDLGTRPLFYKETGAGGTVNWFAGTSTDFMFYQLPFDFNSFLTQYRQPSGSSEFNVPTGGSWVAWLDNSCAIANPKQIDATLQVWHWGINDAGDEAAPAPAQQLTAYPNPFNPETTLSFALARPGEVTLEIFNIRGQRVATLLHEHREAGTHSVTWQAGGTASGVYLARVRVGDVVTTRKMCIMK